MRMNYITFRSVTPAQRGQRILNQAGIYCTLQRTPRNLQEQGCGYCLRLRPGDTVNAVEVLRGNGVLYSRVYAGDTGNMEALSL